MKELQIKTKDQVQEVKVPVKSEQKFLFSHRPHKGHTLYQFEIASRKISELEYQKQDIDFSSKGIKKKAIMKQGYLYCSALNVKNAERKFQNMLLQMIKENLKRKQDEAKGASLNTLI